MSTAVLYCCRCHQRFDGGTPSPPCPQCGQTLAAWKDLPTLVLAAHQADAGGAGTADDDDLVGKQLGTYLIEAFLGQGGMARVYRARHLTLERPCAIKVLRTSLAARDPNAVRSFTAEAQAAAALVHPHVVTLHTIGHEQQRHFIEMEFVDGVSLARLVQSSGPLEATEATRLMVQTSSALALAHKMKIVHRDIKPANVMVTQDGRAKLADFGLAKTLIEGKDKLPLAGTPHYMAPELFCGHPADRRSDVYAMGVMYYCLLTGELPFACESLTELMQVHSREIHADLGAIVRTGGQPARLVVQRCLAYQARDRYADAGALHEELRTLYGSLRSLGSLLREALAGTGARVEGADDWFEVSVQLAGGRSQKVHVRASRDAAVAAQVIEIFSVCSPIAERYFRRALELNAQIPHGAIAIQQVDDRPHFVMSNTYPRSTCDPEEVHRSVLCIAQYADEVEHRLSGDDTR